MKIFISYSLKDREKVEHLLKTLRENGVEVWIDEARIRGGETLWETISAAIQDYEYFVPVLSDNSLVSDWFHREIRHAYKHKHHDKTIPVRLNADLHIEEFPKWLADKLILLASEPLKVLEALDFDRYEKLLSRARTHFRKGRYEQSIDAYSNAIGKTKEMEADSSRDSLLWVELSRCQEASGAIGDAIVSARKAIDIDGNPAAHFQRARCAFKNQDIGMAIEDFRACLRKDPNNASAMNGLGVALFKHRRATFDEIAAIFRKAIELRDNDSDQLGKNELLHKLNLHLGYVLEKKLRDSASSAESMGKI